MSRQFGRIQFKADAKATSKSGAVCQTFVGPFVERVANHGIYFLFDGDECVYIGRSNSGYSRAFQHLEKQWTRCRFLACDYELLDGMERALVAAAQPRLNKHLKRHRDIENVYVPLTRSEWARVLKIVGLSDHTNNRGQP